MKVVIGENREAIDYIKNNQEEKIFLYDNDRRKWGGCANDDKIIDFETLQQILDSEEVQIIVATKRKSAIYFVKDICENHNYEVYTLINGRLLPINMQEIEQYKLNTRELEERNLERYKESRDYYLKIGNEIAYRHACDYINMKKKNPLMPEVSGLELTNYCNLSCKNCPTPTCKRQKGYMDDRVLNETIKYIAPDCKIPITVHGFGEPFLHDCVYEYVESILNIGRPVCVSTNGIKLTDDSIDKILKILGKVEGSKLYISFHTKCSVENWLKCVEWKKNNLDNTTMLYGQVLQHNSDEAFEWLKDVGIIEPENNEYIRFITSHSFAGNVPGRHREYDCVEVNNRYRNCTYHLNNGIEVAWDGRIKICCLDAELVGNIGDIYHLEDIKRKNTPYSLCYTCDPDWTSNFQ